MTVDAAQAVRDFAEALAQPLPGDDLRFDTRVDLSLMELFESIRGELEFEQFGDPALRDYFAEQLVRKIHRDATTPAPWPGRERPRLGQPRRLRPVAPSGE